MARLSGNIVAKKLFRYDKGLANLLVMDFMADKYGGY